MARSGERSNANATHVLPMIISTSRNDTSITEMNYDSGWSTLVLHRNSARIPNFPYHLCPTTLKIVER